jgi:hypothetical protein
MFREDVELCRCRVPVDCAEVAMSPLRRWAIEESFGDEEDDRVRVVMLIVAVDHGDEDERGVEGEHTEVNWAVSDGLPRHKSAGLLECVNLYLLWSR